MYVTLPFLSKTMRPYNAVLLYIYMGFPSTQRCALDWIPILVITYCVNMVTTIREHVSKNQELYAV